MNHFRNLLALYITSNSVSNKYTRLTRWVYSMTCSVVFINQFQANVPFYSPRKCRKNSDFFGNIEIDSIRKWLITLIFSWQRSLSYRNQSIDLCRKSMDWFLYDRDLRHQRAKVIKPFQAKVYFHIPWQRQNTIVSLTFSGIITMVSI